MDRKIEIRKKMVRAMEESLARMENDPAISSGEGFRAVAADIREVIDAMRLSSDCEGNVRSDNVQVEIDSGLLLIAVSRAEEEGKSVDRWVTEAIVDKLFFNEE